MARQLAFSLARRPMRLLLGLLLLVGVLVASSRFAGFAQNAESDRGIVADLISRALSTPNSQVSIGAVEGALSSNVTIRDIVLADRDGPWLRLDRVRLVWTRTALLARRLEVNNLEIGRLEVLRRPLSDPNATPPASDAPILPELPVRVRIQAFQLAELALGAPIVGVPARLSAAGAASLGPPSEGLDLTLDARRLDAQGEYNVRLGFVPQNTRLQLSAKIAEPQGGLIARFADLPGQPPVNLDLSGDGPLDNFRAALNFTAGETIGAQGSAVMSRVGAGRQLALALDSRIEGLMPAPVAPVFAGSTRLDGNVAFADDGAVDIQKLALVSALARLDVAGRYGADANLDLRITAQAVPNQGGKTVASGTEIGKLALDATVKGPVAGPNVVARFEAADAVMPVGRFGSIAASFNATPSGKLGEAQTRIALVADGQASGVALADEGLARAVGDKVVFTLRGTADGQGATEFETLKLVMSGLDFDYRGRLDAARILGRATVALPDLSRLSGLAQRSLAGRADITADIDSAPKQKTYGVTLAGKGEKLVTGIDPLDRLLAGRLELGGEIRSAAGTVSVTGLELSGSHARVTVDGALGQDRSDLRVALAVPDLRRADPRLSGKGDIVANVTGPLARLDASARIALADATAIGRPIPRLAIEAVIRDLQGALETSAKLDGLIEGKPARGTLQLARLPGDGWNLSALDILIGSVSLKGALTLDPQSRAEGRLTLAARNLDDLSALALTKLGGQLDADIALSLPDGRQNLALAARGSRINAAGVSLDRLEAALTAQDIHGRPVLDGNVAVDRAVIGGEPLSALRLQARGAAQASDITLSANARGFALNAAGRLVPGEPLRFDLASFEARRDARRIALSGPASFSFPAGGVEIRNFALAVDRGRIVVDGKAGNALDLTVNARDVPLSAARLFAPRLDLAGTLNAQARVTGTPDRLAGPWELRIAGLATPETRSAGLPPIEIAGRGTLSGQATSVDATLNAGRRATLTVRGTAPLAASGRLDLSAQGRIDTALSDAMLAADGRRLTGIVQLDFRAGGTAAAPRLDGAATLTGGSFTDALQGVRLTGMEARVAANGDNLTIERFVARTPNDGSLSASGRVRIDPAAGFPGEIRLQGRRAQLVSSGLVTAVADLNLSLSGPLAQRPRVEGRIDVSSLDVAVPDRLPASLRPIDGIRHVNAKGTAAARLAQERKANRGKAASRAPAFDATLALVVSAPSRVFIRGRGIDAELGGELRVSGTSSAPILNGGFDLRRGRLTVLTQRLDFSRGRITFTNGITPELDFAAETRAGDVTAQILVTGPANEPAFAFTSQPELPQDEVLSRLLFARASGELSPFQALQLAQTAAQFAGGGGDDAFERLRRSLGVDNLDVQMGAGGPTVGLSRAIGNNITLGVKAGARPQDSGVSVGIDVTRRLKLQAETGADGSAAAGIGAEWEW